MLELPPICPVISLLCTSHHPCHVSSTVNLNRVHIWFLFLDHDQQMDKRTDKQTDGRHGMGIREFVCLFVACLTSQQHVSVPQGRICSDNLSCCHTEIEVADQTFHLTQSQYTDTGPTSPSTDPITPGARQGSHWSANFKVTGMTRPGKILAQAGFEPKIFRSRGGRLNP